MILEQGISPRMGPSVHARLDPALLVSVLFCFVLLLFAGCLLRTFEGLAKVSRVQPLRSMGDCCLEAVT